MIDRRLHPANERVAHDSLNGQLERVSFTPGRKQSVAVEVADLYASPNGSLDRQLLRGEDVTTLEDHNGWSFVVCENAYVGYVPTPSLTEGGTRTHRVGTFATHSYEDEDFKSGRLHALPFGAKLQVLAEMHKFYETEIGYVPKKHLRPLDRPFEDPSTIAQLHFNVPYLWGGNSTRGIDCSGLISASLTACGISCPGDSDMQMALGSDVTGPLQRGDLIFWKGHVAMMVDAETLIHANAHHMACRYEPFAQACLRIKAQGDGEVIAQRRLG